MRRVLVSVLSNFLEIRIQKKGKIRGDRIKANRRRDRSLSESHSVTRNIGSQSLAS